MVSIANYLTVKFSQCKVLTHMRVLLWPSETTKTYGNWSVTVWLFLEPLSFGINLCV